MTKSVYKNKIVHENQVITSTIVVEELLTGISGTLPNYYPLSEADFVRLKNIKPITLKAASSLFFAALGFAFSLLPRLLSELKGQPSQITNNEWVALCIGAGIAAILYIIGFALPSDRKTVLKGIQDHFEKARESRKTGRE